MKRRASAWQGSAWRVGLLLLVFLPAAWASPPLAAREGEVESAEQLQARIARLIEQLGAEQYARREKAQQQLKQLGLVAFDALIEAQRHRDIEIALRARYLVRSMPIRWIHESDSPQVKGLLRNYIETNRADRESRMQQLAGLADSAGIEALCRLVRFETDNLLSKEAALLAINHLPPAAARERTALATRIRDTIGLSKRPAAHWMRAYAWTLEDAEAALGEWQGITEQEQATLAQFPEETSRQIVRDLMRSRAEMLRELGRDPEALEVIRDTLDLVHGDREEMFDFVDWALERQAWSVVDQVAERFAVEFYKHSDLVYRLAEAQRKRGDRQLADQTARQALGLNADRPDRHIETGVKLMMRQMYDWSEVELRHVINTADADNRLTLEARYILSDMLFDIERELDAANEMQKALDAMTSNAKLLQQSGRSAATVRGMTQYYFAVHYARTGEREKQIESLENAVKFVPHQPDFLIAMYRVPEADPQWRQATLKRIEVAAGLLRDRIQRNEQIFNNPRTEEDRLQAMDGLAQANNELAWLISNTEGDFQQAVKYSQRSLELFPESYAYLDTLARCYQAAGELEKAIHYQTMAVQRAPHYQQIRRQLEVFEKELAEKRQDGGQENQEADGGPAEQDAP